jgi:hypothetical protein
MIMGFEAAAQSVAARPQDGNRNVFDTVLQGQNLYAAEQ